MGFLCSTAHHCSVNWFVQLFALVTKIPCTCHDTWHDLAWLDSSRGTFNTAQHSGAWGAGWSPQVKGYSHCAKPAAWRQAHGHFHASVSSAWAPESSKCLQTGKKWSFQGPRKNIPSGRSCEHCDSQNCSSLCGRCAAAFRAAWQKFASYNGNNPRNLLTKPVGFTANNRFHKHFWICWTIWLWNESLQAVCWVHVGCHVGPAPELRLLYTTGWTE